MQRLVLLSEKDLQEEGESLPERRKEAMPMTLTQSLRPAVGLGAGWCLMQSPAAVGLLALLRRRMVCGKGGWFLGN